MAHPVLVGEEYPVSVKVGNMAIKNYLRGQDSSSKLFDQTVRVGSLSLSARGQARLSISALSLHPPQL